MKVSSIPVPSDRFASYSTDKTANAYDASGTDYLAYADGDAAQLFNFTSTYSFADRQIWHRLDATLVRLAADGRKSISILDAGCGPGTWLQRLVLRARELGFARVDAFGFDVSKVMIDLAKAAASRIQDQAIRMHFVVRDITNGSAFGNNTFDITLCLYGVLNHLPKLTHDRVAAELSRVTFDSLFLTVRTIGSQPTIYVDKLERAHAFHQDNDADWMEVDLVDGRHIGFTSHLFSSSDLRTLFQPYLSGIALVGLDVFHGRFSTNSHWNSLTVEDQSAFEADLEQLERRYASNAHFIDRAAHILLIGEH
jgi:SAM-dependent methyltransferase